MGGTAVVYRKKERGKEKRSESHGTFLCPERLGNKEKSCGVVWRRTVAENEIVRSIDPRILLPYLPFVEINPRESFSRENFSSF